MRFLPPHQELGNLTAHAWPAAGSRGRQEHDYGFRPENGPAFQAELLERAITVADIEKIEFRPRTSHLARLTLHHVEIAQSGVSGRRRR